RAEAARGPGAGRVPAGRRVPARRPPLRGGQPRGGAHLRAVRARAAARLGRGPRHPQPARAA
ncbi:unnamed protein product, partial [Heterosigma akashiwo]